MKPDEGALLYIYHVKHSKRRALIGMPCAGKELVFIFQPFAPSSQEFINQACHNQDLRHPLVSLPRELAFNNHPLTKQSSCCQGL
jgi:hypothetical protein